MCGIFSYIGPKTNATQLTVQGLKKLEYRGYDSWGIGYIQENKINFHKQVGKIENIPDRLTDDSTPSNIAISHSRWATHGGVNETNAHPHKSEDKNFLLVHNGIFENYAEVKAKLEKKGYTFKSETDTEVAVQLIQDCYKTEKDVKKAVQKALSILEGRYAILLLNNYTNELIAARRGSPLIIGVGKNNAQSENEFFVASDVPAFIEHTNKVLYLDDNQMAVISLDQTNSANINFYSTTNLKPIQKRVVEVNINPQEAEKGDFKHFMIKEIIDQKETIARSINQDKVQIQKVADLINNAFGTYFIGCGTAGKVGLTGTYIFSKIAKKHINFTFSSEFEICRNFITKGSLVLAISQSGETADTLEALEITKENQGTIVSIVNVDGSSIARMSDVAIPLKVGPEIAVASTKATTSQLAILILLAYACIGKITEGIQLLIGTSGKINDMLNPRYEEHILELAKLIKDVESMYIIGKGENYPIALEAAIKLQEVSYIHAEGFAGGELKHGPLALITEGTPVIVLAPKDENHKHILSNAQEIKARGGYIIGISPENNDVFDYWIKVPEADIDSPIINIIPLQILAYHLAVLRNNDPDMPRNLAKSVTVK
jgi:glucosamine--fructose-6-phosphate aminotransferase (isomerizing)